MEATLLTKRESLRIGSLGGNRLIKTSSNVFKKICFIGLNENALSSVCVATPETLVDIYALPYFGASFEKTYNKFPGTWNQKFLTQEQVIDFCLIYKRWLSLYHEATVFVCKKDETELIDENHPEENLSLVYVNYDGRDLSVSVTSILECDVWQGEGVVRIVLPKI